VEFLAHRQVGVPAVQFVCLLPAVQTGQYFGVVERF
jgi:hypothetical protein